MLHKELQCRQTMQAKKNGCLGFMLASDDDETSMGLYGKN
jgi:hypothetical protein